MDYPDYTNLTQDGGVKKKILIQAPEGAEGPPNVGDVIILGFEVRIEGNETVIETSDGAKNPHVCQAGLGHLIPGCEIAVESMKKGEAASFIVESAYGYGAAGSRKEVGCALVVPSEATCVYDLSLLHFEPFEQGDKHHDYKQLAPAFLTRKGRLIVAPDYESEADRHFADGEWYLAHEQCELALSFLEFDYNDGDEYQDDIKTRCIHLLECLVECCKKLGPTYTQKLVSSLRRILRIDPNNYDVLITAATTIFQVVCKEIDNGDDEEPGDNEEHDSEDDESECEDEVDAQVCKLSESAEYVTQARKLVPAADTAKILFASIRKYCIERAKNESRAKNWKRAELIASIVLDVMDLPDNMAALYYRGFARAHISKTMATLEGSRDDLERLLQKDNVDDNICAQAKKLLQWVGKKLKKLENEE